MKRTLKQRRERRDVLVKSVAMAKRIHGKDAARRIIPEFAGEESITSLAKAMDVNRSALSLCLGAVDGRPATKLKRALEDYLDIPPGGMDEVLAELRDD